MIKFLKFVPVQLTFFLILGILTGKYLEFNPIDLLWIGSIILVIFTTQFLYSNKTLKFTSLFSVLTLFISFFIGISTITFKNEINNGNHYSNNKGFTLERATSIVIKIQKELKPNKYSNKYIGELLQLQNERVVGKVLINISKDSLQSNINIDDELLVNTQFKELQKALNPYSFNYKEYLHNQQIFHQIYVKKTDYLKLEKRSISVKGIAARIRNEINKSLIENGFKENELAVINALILGQRNSISKDLLESYKGAGAIHILAVSGLHIGIILLLLTFIFKPLHNFKRGKLIATMLIILLLWFYAVIAGLSASVVRAVTMFTALTIGMQLVRRSNIYNTLIISMFFLLLFNPFYLFEVGFQLSYLAVFSIVWIQPKIYNLVKSNNWIIDKFWQLLTVSIAAQVGVLPLSLFYFHQFPGLFFLSNLVIIPFLGFILMSGIVIIVLSVAGYLPDTFATIFQKIIEFMNLFVEWIADQSFFLIQDIPFSLSLMLSVYGILFFTLKWIEKRNYNRAVFVLISIISMNTVLIVEKFNLEAENEFIVFNKNRSSVVGQREGDRLVVNTSQPIDKLEYIIKPYVVGTKIGNNFVIKESDRLFKFKKDVILVIDSLGIYQVSSVKPSIVILQNSPKINIERMLKSLQPKGVITDGSNFKSYSKMVEQICLKNKTPFHNTMQKGAFILN